MATVNWTARALAALDGIYDYLHLEAPLYADHVVQQLLDAVDRLEDHPRSGREVPEAEHEDIREVICQRYRILYRVVSAEQVDILAVLHGRRDLSQPGNQPWETH